MEAAFRPAPLETLARWIFRALDEGGPVLGLARESLAVPGPRLASTLQGRPLAAPLGLAAGPHTQLAQNIAAGWLCGARFVELKTVQARDQIEVSRPCIDAADETYNCEWSQELRLEQSFGEYLHAWVLIHALAHRLGLPGPGTLFAMSVGYDLAGIQSAPVLRFIASMRDARAALPAAVDAVARVFPAVRGIAIPERISDHVTLSTMHGCPPAEIERIARFLLGELGVHTWIKLNPTLLGPEAVRGLLNRTLGFDVEVPDAAFAHDPRFDDALAMVERLSDAARGTGLHFGIKLSNTLEVVNRRPVFPATETTSYLSGRALHPITLALAERMRAALGDRVPISFCGGADAENFAGLVRAGLGPVTVCTDLLKPGGYSRLQSYLLDLEAALDADGAADLAAFTSGAIRGTGAVPAASAARAAGEARYAARGRPLRFKGARPLGPFDCVAAPCTEACPAHQEVPAYLRSVAAGRPSEALEIILRTNPLPGVTGSACDHPCTERCVRTLIDAPLAIREVKRFAAERGEVATPERVAKAGVSVAVLGAGPAGIAAAEALARSGIGAEVFEAQGGPGGMVGGVIPAYRMDARALETDLARLRALGVRFHFGRTVASAAALEGLRREFAAVFLGVGAQRGKRLAIPGEGAAGVLDALDFLAQVRAGTAAPPGTKVLVIGGGNSAMDAARTARRLAPQAAVTLVYRRTRAQMPADPAELRDCAEERIGLSELLAPARVVVEDGRVRALACTRMALAPPEPGARGADARPRPVPAPGAEVLLEADTVIAAIGQEPRLDFAEGLGLARGPGGTLAVDEATGETSLPGLYAGGDVVRGPSSIIQAIADGQRAARAIGRRFARAAAPEQPARAAAAPPSDHLLARRAQRVAPQPLPALPATARTGFAEVNLALGPAAAAAEASRCLDCDRLCSLCVTVCPNRANLAFTAAPLALELPALVWRDGALRAEGVRRFAVEQPVQIVNLGDFCNQCGNCVSFCPTAGAPWREKPRFWLDRAGFESATGDVYRLERGPDALAIEARLSGRAHRLERRSGIAEYRSEVVVARLDRSSWRLLSLAPAPGARPPAEGEAIDLTPCATLIALLAAEAVLPEAEGTTWT